MYILAQTIDVLITVYIWMIIIRALLSWARPYSRIPIANILMRLTDPFLDQIRRLIPMPRMAVDISPVIAIVILEVFRYVIPSVLF